MRSLTFDELLAMLAAVQLSAADLARLRKKECRLPYLQCVLESRTVRDAARVTGVHRTTSFRWRHRFVPARCATGRKHYRRSSRPTTRTGWNLKKARAT
jgi:hypothetical protein